MCKSFIYILITVIVLCSSEVAFAQEEVIYEELRDPFIPLIDEKGELRKNFQKPLAEDISAKVQLMGICQIHGIFYALIDGELVKEGNMLKEFRVEKIEKDKVILSFSYKMFELRWGEEKK